MSILLNHYEPNVRATVAFLKLFKVKVNSSTINETLQRHPDWPSLLCISDSLNSWHIPNAAGKIETSQIDDLPLPFIAYTKNQRFPQSVVTRVNDSEVTFYSGNYRKPETKAKEDFVKDFTGVYLIAEPNEASGEKDFAVNKRKVLIESIIPVALFIIITGLSLFFLSGMVNVEFASSITIGIYLQYFILLAGTIVTFLLLWYEVDKNNPLLKKVCTGIVKGNCNAILTGKKSKVFSWLSWSEVGFFYFVGGLIVILFSGNIYSAISIIGFLNLIALPYILFSVYYQWKIARQWCVLCVAVQGLLLLGGINVLSNHLFSSLLPASFSFFITTFFLYLIPALFWYTAKPLVMGLHEAKNTKRQYLRIKFNTQIFDTLLKKQKEITLPTDGLGIEIGNPIAINTLIKVCNPYCGPCSKAHPKIEALLEENSNLKVKIIFTTPNNPEVLAYKPVSHLLAVYEKNNKEDEIKKALDDWYLTDKKDYDVFAAKYPMNGELKLQGDKIDAMNKWCKHMDIAFTPTIFINGFQLPDAYGIEDLPYFLAE